MTLLQFNRTSLAKKSLPWGGQACEEVHQVLLPLLPLLPLPPLRPPTADRLSLLLSPFLPPTDLLRPLSSRI